MKFVLSLIVFVLTVSRVHPADLNIDCFANCFTSGVVDPICTKFEGTEMTAMNEQFITCLRSCGSDIREIHKGKCPGDTKFDEMIEKLKQASDEKVNESSKFESDKKIKQPKEEKTKPTKKSRIEEMDELKTKLEESGEDEILEDEILKDEL